MVQFFIVLILDDEGIDQLANCVIYLIDILIDKNYEGDGSC